MAGRRRRLAIAAAIAILLTLVLATGGALWWRMERAETLTETLLEIVEGSEQEMELYNDRMARQVDVLEQVEDPYDQELRLTEALAARRAAASDAKASVLVAKHEAEGLAASEGAALDRARDAYVDHIDAWVDWYTAVESDPSSTSTGSEITATFQIARSEFENLSLNGEQADRVEAIFSS